MWMRTGGLEGEYSDRRELLECSLDVLLVARRWSHLRGISAKEGAIEINYGYEHVDC